MKWLRVFGNNHKAQPIYVAKYQHIKPYPTKQWKERNRNIKIIIKLINWNLRAWDYLKAASHPKIAANIYILRWLWPKSHHLPVVKIVYMLVVALLSNGRLMFIALLWNYRHVISVLLTRFHSSKTQYTSTSSDQYEYFFIFHFFSVIPYIYNTLKWKYWKYRSNMYCKSHIFFNFWLSFPQWYWVLRCHTNAKLDSTAEGGKIIIAQHKLSSKDTKRTTVMQRSQA